MEKLEIKLSNTTVDFVIEYLYEKIKKLAWQSIDYAHTFTNEDRSVSTTKYHHLIQSIQPPIHNQITVKETSTVEPDGKPPYALPGTIEVIIFKGHQLQLNTVLLSVEFKKMYKVIALEYINDLKEKFFEQSMSVSVKYPPALEIENKLGTLIHEEFVNTNAKDFLLVVKQAHERIGSKSTDGQLLIVDDKKRNAIHFCKVIPEIPIGLVEGKYGTIEVVPQPNNLSKICVYSDVFFEIDTKKWMLDQWGRIRQYLHQDGWKFAEQNQDSSPFTKSNNQRKPVIQVSTQEHIKKLREFRKNWFMEHGLFPSKIKACQQIPIDSKTVRAHDAVLWSRWEDKEYLE